MTGSELRAIRTALRLSQAQLAARLGVARNTIIRWENGGMVIQHPQILTLALQHLQEHAASL